MWADCLVINFMTLHSEAAPAKAPPDTMVIWVGWGAGYYRFIEPFLGDFYLPLTSMLVLTLRMTDKPIHLRLLELARRGCESPAHVLRLLASRLGSWAGKDGLNRPGILK